jgi:CheY-like chemotaxis protein
MAVTNRKFAVLLADDSSDDRLFMRRIIERSDRLSVVGEVRDGQEAIEYLKGEGALGDRAQHPYPDILLLDLQMPRKSGFDVLQWMKGMQDKHMLVFVMSGSRLSADVDKSHKLGADGYFKKTSERSEQDEIVRAIVYLADKHFSGEGKATA